MIHLWRSDKTKIYGLGEVNYEKVNRKYIAKINRRVILIDLFVQIGFDTTPQSPVIRMFSSWYSEGTFLMVNFMTCF